MFSLPYTSESMSKFATRHPVTFFFSFPLSIFWTKQQSTGKSTFDIRINLGRESNIVYAKPKDEQRTKLELQIGWDNQDDSKISDVNQRGPHPSPHKDNLQEDLENPVIGI